MEDEMQKKMQRLLYYTKFCKFISVFLGFRKIRNFFIRRKLAPYEFSIFANNCLGGVFLHDAGKRFNSPWVNLATTGEGFITFLENPEAYLDGEFENITPNPYRYPFVTLHGIQISLVHYHTTKEGAEKWKSRSKRILWNNLYVVATGHDGMERADLMDRFDKLPYKNKVMFTFGNWPQYKWAHQVKIAHGIPRPFTEFATITGKRFYETTFDLSKWISENEAQMFTKYINESKD